MDIQYCREYESIKVLNHIIFGIQLILIISDYDSINKKGLCVFINENLLSLCQINFQNNIKEVFFTNKNRKTYHFLIVKSFAVALCYKYY